MIKIPENVDEIKEQITFSQGFDKESRGTYLFHAIWVDTFLKQILAYHFCPKDQDKRNHLAGLIFNELTFNSKIRYFLKVLNKYPKIKKNHPDIESKLENVRDLRNKFAHSQLDTSVEFLKKKAGYIRLEFYKDGMLQHYNITQEFMDKKFAEIMDLLLELSTIAEIITNGETGNLQKF